MRISPNWLREFIDLKVEARQLADDLTLAGVAVERIEGSGKNPIFEMEITTNRPDAMNHYGVARECSAIYDLPLKEIEPKLRETKREPLKPEELRIDIYTAGGKADQAVRVTHVPSGTVVSSTDLESEKANRAEALRKLTAQLHPDFPIEIVDPQLCGRYSARVICDVKIGASPKKIADRLLIEEQHGINNIADATNYVLMEMGHPTHAFDLDLLEGGRIIVRLAKPGEFLKTLDGLERKLHPEDLVIADARKPVALAGVMGGWDSMITDKTRNVLIESAWFDPATVRRTSRRHGMHTDASHRFERGADWGATTLACNRVAEVILQSAGGKLEGGLIDVVGRDLHRPFIQLSRSEIRRILGKDIPETDVLHILRRLGFVMTAGPNVARPIAEARTPRAIAEDPEAYTVEIPTWRMDVERDIDLIEEIARVYGFNRFENTLPAFKGSSVELPDAKKESLLRSRLLAMGYNEAVSSSFISRPDASRFSFHSPVELANPLSDEAPVLRNSLVPGMIDMTAWNLNRGTTDVALFEAGKVFAAEGANVDERKALCIGATGNVSPATAHASPEAFSFYHLKGAIEGLLALFSGNSVTFEAPAGEYYHPGRSARITLKGSLIGQLGQIHPSVTAERKLRQEVFAAELYLDRLLQSDLREPRYERLSRFPAIERDFSLIVPNEVRFAQIEAAIGALKIEALRSVTPREIFRGGSVPAGKYSLLLSTVFQSSERTLRDDEVARWSNQIIKAMERLGAILRS
jgi:phenylalanyl-tRNA synthetase beta chain